MPPIVKHGDKAVRTPSQLVHGRSRSVILIPPSISHHLLHLQPWLPPSFHRYKVVSFPSQSNPPLHWPSMLSIVCVLGRGIASLQGAASPAGDWVIGAVLLLLRRFFWCFCWWVSFESIALAANSCLHPPWRPADRFRGRRFELRCGGGGWWGFGGRKFGNWRRRRGFWGGGGEAPLEASG